MIKAIRDRLICLLYRGLDKLSFDSSTRLGSLASTLLYRLNTQQTRVIRKNLSIAFPDLDSTELEQLTRSSLFESATTMLQIPRVWKEINSLLQKPDYLRMQTIANLDEVRKSGKGAVLITPHIGNWELFGLYLATQMNLMILYKPHAIECLRIMTETGRASTGALLATTDATGLRSLIRHLRNGGFVGILPDQIPSQSNGVFAPFFDFPAYTATLAGALAKRHKVPIYIGYALRRKDHFELSLEKIQEPLQEYDDIQIAALINQYIEKVIARCPEQYNWSYKRFRRCPPEIQNPYQELKR